MMKDDELNLILLEGETLTAKFKEKITNIDREVVAFANAFGGSIFLGVNDDGQITGINITNKLKSQIQDIARNCDPSIKITLVSHRQTKILEIKIEEGLDKPYRCKNGFFIRNGPSAQKLKRDEIIQFISDVGKIHFDRTHNKTFKYPTDFSKIAFEKYLKFCGVSIKAPIKDILVSLNAAEEINHAFEFTNTGVLFFAKNPQKFFPEAYITCVKYKSFDRFSIIDKKDFFGSPIEQIEAAMSFFLQHVPVELKISPSYTNKKVNRLATREDIYDYPLVALREAVINAVCHRDYLYDGSHIYIHMYPDRIEIENPGGLYNGLTLENLGKRSIRRNPLIADLLHRAKYIEKVGSGFDRMRHTLKENKNPDIEINATNFFNIRFYRRLSTEELTNLSIRQTHLYNIMKERKTITKKETAVALNVSEDTALRELNALIEIGIIEKEGVGKATVYCLLKDS